MALNKSLIRSLTYEDGQSSVKELISGRTADCFALAKYVMYNAQRPALVVSYTPESGSHFSTLSLTNRGTSGEFIEITGVGSKILPVVIEGDLQDHFEDRTFSVIETSTYLACDLKDETQNYVHITQPTQGCGRLSLITFPMDPIGYMHRLMVEFTPDERSFDPVGCILQLAADLVEEEIYKEYPAELPV